MSVAGLAMGNHKVRITAIATDGSPILTTSFPGGMMSARSVLVRIENRCQGIRTKSDVYQNINPDGVNGVIMHPVEPLMFRMTAMVKF